VHADRTTQVVNGEPDLLDPERRDKPVERTLEDSNV